MTAFGQVLRDMRGALGLSQAEMALQIGTTQRHLSFVETGRSAPTAYFVTRLCRELNVSLAQRSNLFAAAGLPQAYPARDPASPEITAALDTMERCVLRHWPFPAIVMNPAWTILRSNRPFRTLFAPFLPETGNRPANLAEIMMRPDYRSMVVNWPDIAEHFYYRLQWAATRHDEAKEVFAGLKAAGLFDVLPRSIPGAAPIFTPVDLRFPDGTGARLTSMVGQLMTVQDPLVEGYEIELFVPLDDDSATALTPS
ncbi:transcriptional regulator [Primorskyibacter flagellatus]|uniref:Transcriptional regulator n=1 Tax=Primorskyibacter flagellatus TaxID=1387277 RepID=A0A916ZW27_9RHOB|nr:helix-turn-helix domain-containing protein [Primorskyibacter flagellatus]GGE16612.1 transcriptional regulator [Primorskyibacter flagellatus]